MLRWGKGTQRVWTAVREAKPASIRGELRRTKRYRLEPCRSTPSQTPDDRSARRFHGQAEGSGSTHCCRARRRLQPHLLGAGTAARPGPCPRRPAAGRRAESSQHAAPFRQHGPLFKHPTFNFKLKRGCRQVSASNHQALLFSVSSFLDSINSAICAR